MTAISNEKTVGSIGDETRQHVITSVGSINFWGVEWVQTRGKRLGGGSGGSGSGCSVGGGRRSEWQVVGVAAGRSGSWSEWQLVGVAAGRSGKWSGGRGVAGGRSGRWSGWQLVGVASGQVVGVAGGRGGGWSGWRVVGVPGGRGAGWSGRGSGEREGRAAAVRAMRLARAGVRAAAVRWGRRFRRGEGLADDAGPAVEVESARRAGRPQTRGGGG